MIGHNDAGVFPHPGMTTRGAADAPSQTHIYYDSSSSYHGMADLGKHTPAYSLQADVAYMVSPIPVPSVLWPADNRQSPHEANTTKQPRAYTTPETSPPMVSHRGGGQTRRTTQVSKPRQVNSTHSKGNRVSKPAPKKKKKEKGRGEGGRPKKQDRLPVIQRPLSELAGGYPSVEVPDIAAYVERPKEDRLREVAEDKKDPGKIKRPMNSFMLYRKAYQNLAKALSHEQHHNIISQVAGDGWRMEPEHVRKQFENWSTIEKENHHNTYPNYKFAPTKSSARKPKKGRADSEDGAVLDDPDWEFQRPARDNSRRGLAAEATPMSIFEPFHPHGSPDPGMLHTPAPPPYTTTGEALPPPYDNTSAAGAQYYQQHIHHPMPGRSGLVEDVMIRGTPSPAAYGDEQDAYRGPPGQYPPIAQHGVPEQVIDPSLVAGPDAARYTDFYAGFSFDADRQWQGHEMPGSGAPVLQEDSMAPLDSVLGQDPDLPFLRGNDGSWQLSEVGEQQHQLDGWAA